MHDLNEIIRIKVHEEEEEDPKELIKISRKIMLSTII